jgi:hypothetical protein
MLTSIIGNRPKWSMGYTQILAQSLSGLRMSHRSEAARLPWAGNPKCTLLTSKLAADLAGTRFRGSRILKLDEGLIDSLRDAFIPLHHLSRHLTSHQL